MPHFENSYAERGAPIVAQNVTRDFGMRDHLNWEHLAQIRRQWNGRLVVKGIMRGEDARIAREHGVDGIVVSNHGGRQLDGTVSPLRVLPEIVARGRRHAGDDGQRRPARLGCPEGPGASAPSSSSSGGRFSMPRRSVARLGVLHAIDILSTEINRNMGLLGINTLAEMRPELLFRLKDGSADCRRVQSGEEEHAVI